MQLVEIALVRNLVEQQIGPGFVKELGLPSGEGSVVAALMAKSEIPLLDWLTLRDLMHFAKCNDEALALLITLTLTALNRGSLCLELDAAQLNEICQETTGEPFRDHCGRIIDELELIRMEKSRWCSIIGNSVADAKPLVLQGKGCRYMYFQKHLTNVLSLQDRFNSYIDKPLTPLTDTVVAAEVLERVISSQKVRLNDQQQLAAAMALLQSFTVISGGPGTGKTSIISVLLQCLVECGVAVEDIAIVAPTGRAAQRTTEAILGALPDSDGDCEQPLAEIKGRTIHSLLSYSPTQNGFTYGEDRRLPHKVVIVDEVSMVDAQLMASLMMALREDARILFLGDKDQLPSVEAGAVLAELIPPATQTMVSEELAETIIQILPNVKVPCSAAPKNGLNDRIVVLTESYRSERSILDVAGKINGGNADVFKEISLLSLNAGPIDFSSQVAGVYFAEIAADADDQLQHVLDSWAACRYVRDHSENSWLNTLERLSGVDLGNLPELSSGTADLLDSIFDHLISGQILTLLRAGNYGVKGINNYLCTQIRRLTDPGMSAGYFHGQPVIVRQNVHSLGLSNGDLGMILRDVSGVRKAVFRQLGGYSIFAIDSIPALESAFAITVHKSQGSEYGDVLLVLPPNRDNPLLCKEILYTGMTRAKKSVSIVGNRVVFSAAVKRAVQRQSGVSFWADNELEPPPDTSDFTDLPLFQ